MYSGRKTSSNNFTPRRGSCNAQPALAAGRRLTGLHESSSMRSIYLRKGTSGSRVFSADGKPTETAPFRFRSANEQTRWETHKNRRLRPL
jgi:hypothetical protein